MTQEQRRRIVQALDETNTLLAKEMRYSPDLRKLDRVTFYERHIAKLVHHLETDDAMNASWVP